MFGIFYFLIHKIYTICWGAVIVRIMQNTNKLEASSPLFSFLGVLPLRHLLLFVNKVDILNQN